MRTFIICILLVACCASVEAQSRSLDYYLYQAIDYSPAIAEQRNNANVARLQKDIISAELSLPSVTATGDYMYAPFSNHWGYDPAITDGGHYSALLNMDYPLFTGEKKRSRKEASSVNIRRSEYQISVLKHELNQSVTDQYIIVYQDRLHLQYLEHIHQLLSQQQRVLQSLAKQGITNITDVKQLTIELQDNQIAQNQAENAYQRDLLQLNAQCGIKDSMTSIELQSPALMIDSMRVERSHFMQQFSLDNLDIAARQEVSELKYQPDISLYGTSGLNAVKLTGIQDYFGYSVGVQVSVPIFDGNQKNISRQQSNLQKHSIDAYQQRFKTTRQLQLGSLRRQLEQTNQQLDLTEQQVSQYQNLLKDYQKAMEQGVLSVVDYLTVVRNYAAARQQRIQTIGEKWRLQNQFNYWNW